MPDVLVLGTTTGIGKTWVTARLIAQLRSRGLSIAARKPVQTFDPKEDEPTDAAVLAAASGEPPFVVCPANRTLPVALAPPMAAIELGSDPFTVVDLVTGMAAAEPETDLRVIEGVGGPRSPIAVDGDNVSLADAIGPHLVLLVAPSGLGAINDVELGVGAMPSHPTIVFLNKFDPAERTHRLNHDWLVTRHRVVTDIEALADAVIEATSHSLLAHRSQEDQ